MCDQEFEKMQVYDQRQDLETSLGVEQETGEEGIVYGAISQTEAKGYRSLVDKRVRKIIRKIQGNEWV